MSLRKTFTIFAAALIALTLSASSALIVVVGELHSVATSLDEALESVRIAKQLRIELLEADVLTRSGAAEHGPAVSSSEASLRALLDEASSHRQSGEEGRLLARARERIDAFLDATRGPNRAAVGPSLDAAHGALRDLVKYNVALARTARRDANRLDRTAGRVGVIMAALIVAGALACLLWARRNVLAPLLDLRTGIARFANRDRAVRLQPHGPPELQQVASTFNTMADELARQRQERLSMLGGVAHDLRNPLSVLRVATSAFSPERDLPPESRLRGVLSLVHRQVTRLDRMRLPGRVATRGGRARAAPRGRRPA